MTRLIMSGKSMAGILRKFRKEVLANGQIVFFYDNGSVTYRYEFAEL